jgi:hypothetical protein
MVMTKGTIIQMNSVATAGVNSSRAENRFMVSLDRSRTDNASGGQSEPVRHFTSNGAPVNPGYL